MAGAERRVEMLELLRQVRRSANDQRKVFLALYGLLLLVPLGLLVVAHGRGALSGDVGREIAAAFLRPVAATTGFFGDAFAAGAWGDRNGIRRYGFVVTPMDDAQASVAVDLSRRPYLIFQVPPGETTERSFNRSLAKEFFKSIANHGDMNLHVNVPYGENEHHILEAAFKSFGRALRQAVGLDARVRGVRSSKGSL